MKAETEFPHTGERGHVWEHEKRRPWPPAEILDRDEPQRSTKGPLACAGCGVLWPGITPCTSVSS